MEPLRMVGIHNMFVLRGKNNLFTLDFFSLQKSYDSR